MKEEEYLYRYTNMQFGSEDSRFCEIKLILSKYRVIKTTRCGKWITSSDYLTYADQYVDKKFVNMEAKKRFACPTEKEALQSFIARKNRQISILSHQLDVAKRAREIAEEKEHDEK